MNAPKSYPRRIDHKKWARNLRVPDAQFLRKLVQGQNHIMAYRRKTWARTGHMEDRWDGATGTTAVWRFRCHSGYGATQMVFMIGFGTDVSGSATDPRITIDVTDVAAASTQTRTMRYGIPDPTAGHVPDFDTPSRIAWRRGVVAIDGNKTYEVLVSAVDWARPLAMCAYEVASPEVDSAVDFYHELEPGLEQPVWDSIRQRTLEGLSKMWRKNGSHLVSFLGKQPGAANITTTSTTWANLIDGSTSVSAATPGYYLGDTDPSLLQHTRLSAGDVLNVVLAVHGSCTGSATGEVRFQNASGTICSLTGIGTAAAWYTTTTTISSASALTKADLQFRTSNGANTFTCNAVSLYTYLA